MNPYEQQQQADARARAAALMANDPAAAAYLVNQGLANQKVAFVLPYWSTVRFATTRSGSGPYVYAMPVGTRKAFSYKIGGNATAAGFSSSATITETETNLSDENQTRNGENVEIFGISAMLDPTASLKLAKHVWRNTALFLQLGGDSQIPLGTLAMCPSGGGLFGSSIDPYVTPPIMASVAVDGAVSNGNPTAQNFLPLPFPIQWSGVNNGRDTIFNIIADLKTAGSFSITERTAVAQTTDIAGVAAYAALADAAVGTYVDVTFRLWARRQGGRSVNV